MNNLKDKIQFLVIGLLLGLIIGGGFFIFKLDDYFKELRSYQKLFHQQEKINASNLPKEEANLKSKSNPKILQKRNSIALAALSDSTKKTNSKELKNDSSIAQTKDSTDKTNADDDILIRKDEFLTSNQIGIINISTTELTLNDSLMQKLSGIRDDAPKAFCKIEYWKSPVNYKGYKMFKNKIVLYGINPSEQIKLYKIEDDIYLRSSQNAYKLSFSNDYSAFEKINDESVLAKIK